MGLFVALLVLLLAGLGDRSGIVTGDGVVVPASATDVDHSSSEAAPGSDLERSDQAPRRTANVALHHSAMQARGALGSRALLLVVGLIVLAILGVHATVARRLGAIVLRRSRLIATGPARVRTTAWTSRGPPASAV